MLPHFLILHPIMIANTFLILMMLELSKIYKTYKPIRAMFMAGFYCGIAIIITPHFIILLLFIVQALLMLRDVNLKEFLQSLIGMMVPIFMLAAFGLTNTESTLHFLHFDLVMPTMPTSLQVEDWVGLVVLLMVILYIIFNQQNLRRKKSVKSQLMVSLLFFIIFYTLPMMLFESALVAQHLTTLVIPLSVLFTMLLFVTKRLLVAELIHVALLVFVILFQFDIIL